MMFYFSSNTITLNVSGDITFKEDPAAALTTFLLGTVNTIWTYVTEHFGVVCIIVLKSCYIEFPHPPFSEN